MPFPPLYNPVYHLHFRLPEPGLHSNPLLQTPPMLHFEGLHTIQWLTSDPKKLTDSVRGDGMRFALRGHDSGKFIPHIPYPPTAGPFLLDTLLNSKYQILFHQPNVLLEGQAVGIYQFLVAPPWRCAEIKLPLPRFLAKRGAAAAAGHAKRAVQSAREAVRGAEKARDAAEELWDRAESLESAAAALKSAEAAEARGAEAQRERAAAGARRNRESSWRVDEARIAAASQDEAAARKEKAEYDRLARRGQELSREHDEKAEAWRARADASEGKERREARDAEHRHRASARASRDGAAAWSSMARDAELRANRQSNWMNEKRRKRADEAKERLRGSPGKAPKPNNPHKDATGAGNVGVTLPSLVTHIPYPGTVEIQASWSLIGKTWAAGASSAASELMSGWVGFLFDLVPSSSAWARFALDLAKGIINDTLFGSARKLLLEDKVSFKVLNRRIGLVPVEVALEKDARGEWVWRASGFGNSGRKLDPPLGEAQGEKLQQLNQRTPPVDYAPATPEVGAP